MRLDAFEERIQLSAVLVEQPDHPPVAPAAPSQPASTDVPANHATADADESLVLVPLTKNDLVKLKNLLEKKNPTPIEEKERDALIKRMKESGVEFAGTGELSVLSDILTAAAKLPAPKIMTAVFDAYGSMLNLALGGLQRIEIEKYEAYKRDRDGGAPHEEAWTWANGGANALMQYELEKLKERLDREKKRTSPKIDTIEEWSTQQP